MNRRDFAAIRHPNCAYKTRNLEASRRKLDCLAAPPALDSMTSSFAPADASHKFMQNFVATSRKLDY
jgi:hypothetical protein